MGLVNFHKMSVLKQCAIDAIAFSMGAGEVKDLRESFNAIDVNNDGVVSLQEFQNALNSSSKMSKEEIDKLFASIDRDQTGKIQYSEFCTATLARAKFQKRERLERAYKCLDADDTGGITVKDLQSLMNGMYTNE